MSRSCFLAFVLALSGCSLSDLVDVDPPSNVVDPSTIATKSGAIQLSTTAIRQLAIAYGGRGGSGEGQNVITMSGGLTDELMHGWSSAVILADLRRSEEAHPFHRENYDAFYAILHNARTSPQQAREAVRLYYSDAPGALPGKLYTAEAYAVLWFAELYCSGIPLTSVPLNESPIPTAGFTTIELYERAIALFDSALVLSIDSVPLANLARVGKSRALLGLGRFAEAAAAVQTVPTDFVYFLEFSSSATLGINSLGDDPAKVQVVDGEGGNGLTWSADPRTPLMTVSWAGDMLVPAKYSRTSTGTLDPNSSFPNTPIRLADGLEARLIEAEADLAAGGSAWLTTLNMLRASCVGTAPCAPVPGLSSSSLSPLADPGTPAARLDLLMRERAMWLFLTGHRLGDLRRLARIYDRNPATLYTVGTYDNAGFPPSIAPSDFHGRSYGADLTLRVGQNVEKGNALYKGCFTAEP